MKLKSSKNLVLCILSLMACQLESCEDQKKDFQETNEREKILELHNIQKVYHFEKKAEEFVNQLSDNHISVNRGEIDHLVREDFLNMIRGYFETVEFIKWDDIQPPIIRFSKDKTLAYTIVNKEVELNYSGEDEKEIRERIEFAWVSIYRKHADGWKNECTISTNKPAEKTVLHE